MSLCNVLYVDPFNGVFIRMKMKKELFCIIFFLISNIILAQNIVLKGYVLKDSTNSPIIYANIAIKGNPLGVSSNEAGEFCFYFSDNYINDTLSVSAIGYESYECLVNEVCNKDSLVIILKEKVYELQDVFVFPDEKLKDIINNVTKNLKRNYPNRKHLLTGFYRELVLKDNSYTRLIEAAVDIQKPGFYSNEKSLIRVNELRKSDSYIEYDWKSRIFNKMFGEQNLLYSTLGADIIQYHNKSFKTKYIFTKDFIDFYDFVLENITMSDSVRIFKIRFFEKALTEGDFSAIQNYWIWVREDNYAVIKYDFKIQILKNFDTYKTVNIGENYIYAESVYYKEYNNRYYPYLLEYSRLINAKGADENTGKGKQYMKSTLLINNIVTKRSDEYEKVKKKLSSPADVDLYNQYYKYNPEFWSNYNILKLNPLYKQVRSDIGKEKSLEEQFIENGK